MRASATPKTAVVGAVAAGTKTRSIDVRVWVVRSTVSTAMYRTGAAAVVAVVELGAPRAVVEVVLDEFAATVAGVVEVTGVVEDGAGDVVVEDRVGASDSAAVTVVVVVVGSSHGAAFVSQSSCGISVAFAPLRNACFVACDALFAVTSCVSLATVVVVDVSATLVGGLVDDVDDEVVVVDASVDEDVGALACDATVVTVTTAASSRALSAPAWPIVQAILPIEVTAISAVAIQTCVRRPGGRLCCMNNSPQSKQRHALRHE